MPRRDLDPGVTRSAEGSLKFESQMLDGERLRHDRRGRRKDNPHYKRLNNVTAIALTILVLAAPIPIASNRPVFWMFWAAVLGILAVVYLVAGGIIDSQRPLRSRRYAWLLVTAAMVPAFAVVQILPIADLLPGALRALPETGANMPQSISIFPDGALVGCIRTISYIVFFMLMIEVSARASRAAWIGWILFFGVAAHAVWAMISLNMLGDNYFWGEKLSYRGSATGTFINRNSFATFLGMGLMLGLALLLDRRNRLQKSRRARRGLLSAEALDGAVLWFLTIFITITLLATQSRMGVFATFVGGVTCIVLMAWKTTAKTVRGSIWGLLIAGAGLVILLLLFGRGLIERSIFTEVDGGTRIELYRQVVGMILQRPLTGYGLDAFPLAFEMFHRPPLLSEGIWDYAHSTYLALWAELGLVFGSIPLIIGLAIAAHLLSIVRNRPTDYALSVAAFAALLLAATHSLVDFSLEMQANVFLLLALIALGIARNRSPSSTDKTG